MWWGVLIGFVLGFAVVFGALWLALLIDEGRIFRRKGTDYADTPGIIPNADVVAHLQVANCSANYVEHGRTFVVTAPCISPHPGVAVVVRPDADLKDWRKAIQLAREHGL